VTVAEAARRSSKEVDVVDREASDEEVEQAAA
jgi:hypothetical protein